MIPDARELHRIITASVRELLETARLEAQAGAMDEDQVERLIFRAAAPCPQRGAVDRRAARRAAPEYRPRDVGGLPRGAYMNTWGIPDWLEREVRERDKTCIYCGIPMIEKMPPGGTRHAVATWEHIVDDARIVTRENIARCCVACNSSKGVKNLSDWIQSSYCKKRGISTEKVSEVVKQALQKAQQPVQRSDTPSTSEERTQP